MSKTIPDAPIVIGRQGEHITMAVHDPTLEKPRLVLLSEQQARRIANDLEQAIGNGWGRTRAGVIAGLAKDVAS